MISKVAKVKSSSAFNIKTLNEYLRLGHKDEPKLENERVKNFFTLNMYSDDLETATQEMMYTASLNTRSKCSKYMHLVLSLSEGEKSDLNTWKKIINDYIKEVDMENHQVIAVQHNDNGKEHFHLIINRIDTNSHARTNDYQLYRKLQKFDEEIEKKYNLKQFDHKADTVHNYQQAAINRAKDVEKKTEHQTFLSYLLEHKEDIKKVNSWKELQHKLSEFDCTINIKGRGLVIKSTNPEHPAEVKASSFDRDFSYSKLLKKWGLPPDLNNQSSESDNEENKKEYQRKENLKHTFEEKPLTKNAKRIEYTAYFFQKIEDRKDKVIDKGDRLIVQKANNYKTIQDCLKIAKHRFGDGNIRVTGSLNYQRRVMHHALKMGIKVVLTNENLKREYEAQVERLKKEKISIAKRNAAILNKEKQQQMKHDQESSDIQRKKAQEKLKNEQDRRNQQHTEPRRNQSIKERGQHHNIHR